MRKLDYMDFLGRLPAPADFGWLECADIKEGIAPRTAQEIDPEVRSPGIGIGIFGKPVLWVVQRAAPVDQAGIGNKIITLATGDNGQSAVFSCPVWPEMVIPIDPLDPFTLGFDPVTEPDKMFNWRISGIKEVIHYGL